MFSISDEKGTQQTDMLTNPQLPPRLQVMGALFFANEVVVVRNRQTTTFDLSSGLIFGNDAEKAVRFVSDAGGEIDSVAQREHIPQAIKLERRAIGPHERLNESARYWIVNVNQSVTEIADPKFAVNLSESPWSIEIPVGDQASEEVAAGVEHIDETKAGTGNVILSFGILLGIGHKDFAIEIPDAKWSITGRKVRVDKATGIHLMKIFIVGFDLPCMKIRRIQEIVAVGDAERCAFVNGTVNTMIRTVINGDDGVRLIQRRVPPRNGTVFTDKDEQR